MQITDQVSQQFSECFYCPISRRQLNCFSFTAAILHSLKYHKAWDGWTAEKSEAAFNIVKTRASYPPSLSNIITLIIILLLLHRNIPHVPHTNTF